MACWQAISRVQTWWPERLGHGARTRVSSDNLTRLFAGASKDGSDGTRTRDLRRDRPSRARQRPTTRASERPHLQALFALTQTPLRMVGPTLESTRVGHEMLSSTTTSRLPGRLLCLFPRRLGGALERFPAWSRCGGSRQVR